MIQKTWLNKKTLIIKKRLLCKWVCWFKQKPLINEENLDKRKQLLNQRMLLQHVLFNQLTLQITSSFLINVVFSLAFLNVFLFIKVFFLNLTYSDSPWGTPGVIGIGNWHRVKIGAPVFKARAGRKLVFRKIVFEKRFREVILRGEIRLREKVSSKKVFGGTGKSSTLNARHNVLLGTCCFGCISEYSKSGQTNKSTWLLHASALRSRGRWPSPECPSSSWRQQPPWANPRTAKHQKHLTLSFFHVCLQSEWLA